MLKFNNKNTKSHRVWRPGKINNGKQWSFFVAFFVLAQWPFLLLLLLLLLLLFLLLFYFLYFFCSDFFWYLFFFFHLEHSFFPQPPISYWQKFPTQKNFLKQYTYADFFAISQKEQPNSTVFCFVSKHKKANLLPIIDLTPHK